LTKHFALQIKETTMKKVFVIGLFLSAVLFSCNNAVEINDDQLKDNKQEAVNKTICLELSFPITYIMPDGTTITGNDRKEVGTAMSSWHDANPDSKERAVMQYPVNANFK
jgi:predicted SprT family Zn-dependent metalloprotease